MDDKRLSSAILQQHVGHVERYESSIVQMIQANKIMVEGLQESESRSRSLPLRGHDGWASCVKGSPVGRDGDGLSNIIGHTIDQLRGFHGNHVVPSEYKDSCEAQSDEH